MVDWEQKGFDVDKCKFMSLGARKMDCLHPGQGLSEQSGLPSLEITQEITK